MSRTFCNVSAGFIRFICVDLGFGFLSLVIFQLNFALAPAKAQITKSSSEFDSCTVCAITMKCILSKNSKAPEKSSCTNNRTCSHSKDRKWGGIWPLLGWTWTDLNENRGNWILLGWTRSALVVFVHERNAYCSCSFLGTLVRITKVGIFSDDRGLDWLEWDTGIEVARSCIFVIASPFSDQIGEHYLFWQHFIIGLHFL